MESATQVYGLYRLHRKLYSINYYIHNLYNNMGYIYDTDSAERSEAMWVI